MSAGRSSTSKIRPNSAIDVETATPIPCSALTGPTSRLSMLANATAVPIEIVTEPCARAHPGYPVDDRRHHRQARPPAGDQPPAAHRRAHLGGHQRARL